MTSLACGFDQQIDSTNLCLQSVVPNIVQFLSGIFLGRASIETKNLCSDAFVSGTEKQLQDILHTLTERLLIPPRGDTGKITISIHDVRRAEDGVFLPGSTTQGKYVALSLKEAGNNKHRGVLKNHISFKCEEITIRDEIKKGSVFTVYFPRVLL